MTSVIKNIATTIKNDNYLFSSTLIFKSFNSKSLNRFICVSNTLENLDESILHLQKAQCLEQWSEK